MLLKLKRHPEPGLRRFNTTKKLPPKCPNCKKRLIKVFENDYKTYVFDPESGTYRDSDGYLEMFCPYCDAKLYDVFEDGVCNYVT